MNLNKIALLRNSRGRNFPDPLDFGRWALECGAHGLTVHPRPDERHAKLSDLKPMRDLVQSFRTSTFEPEFNIEGYPSADFLSAVIANQPDQCTLVPDPPHALTSNAGWDFVANEKHLREVTSQLKEANIRVSLFLDPARFDDAQLTSILRIGCQRIELYTEAYAHAFAQQAETRTLLLYRETAQKLHSSGLELNAGHDLNQENLAAFIEEIPFIKEVSIGHALIVEALIHGFVPTVNAYLKILKASS